MQMKTSFILLEMWLFGFGKVLEKVFWKCGYLDLEKFWKRFGNFVKGAFTNPPIHSIGKV